MVVVLWLLDYPGANQNPQEFHGGLTIGGHLGKITLELFFCLSF